MRRAQRTLLFSVVLGAACGGPPASLWLDLSLNGVPAPATLRVTLFGRGRLAESRIDVGAKRFPGSIRIQPLDVSQPDPRVLVDGLDSTGALSSQAATRFTAPAPGQTVRVPLALGARLADTDGDGVPDVIDDCLFFPDPDQLCGGADGGLVDLAPDLASKITLLGVTSASTSAVGGTLSLARPPVPDGTLFIAWVGVGAVNNTTQPVITPPTGWSLIRRTDHTTFGALALYTHLAQSTDVPNFTWQTSLPVIAVGWIAAFGGADASALQLNGVGQDQGTATNSYTMPPLTALSANSMILSSIYSRTSSTQATSWAASSDLGVDVLANVWSRNTRSGAAVEMSQPLAGATTRVTFVTAPTQDWAIVDVQVLAPAR